VKHTYPRDMHGYGQHPVKPDWPQNARIAVQFVINYEEGGENNVLHGDPGSETFLSEIIGANAYPARHMSMESLYEYGSRAGFWRLHRAFTARQIPVTVFGVAMAMERHPEAVEAMLKADWEIACHGYRWIDYQFMPEDAERAHMQQAIEIHQRLTGAKPLGWYTGRDSPNTRRLVIEQGGFLYDSDSYADDLPYWYKEPHKEHDTRHLVIPYTLDNNDMRFAAPQGFNAGDQFYNYLTDAFDTLFDEGGPQAGCQSPKMMNIGLHCRIIGKPGRFQALLRFLDYVQSKPDVWLCRRVDIARHWHANHAP
jgi:allantoinase